MILFFTCITHSLVFFYLIFFNSVVFSCVPFLFCLYFGLLVSWLRDFCYLKFFHYVLTSGWFFSRVSLIICKFWIVKSSQVGLTGGNLAQPPGQFLISSCTGYFQLGLFGTFFGWFRHLQTMEQVCEYTFWGEIIIFFHPKPRPR